MPKKEYQHANKCNEKQERVVFYENKTCMEGSRFLTLQLLSGGNKMENPITICEAITQKEVAIFWEQLHAYHKRDIFPDSDHEDLKYFLGSEYYKHMMKVHSRP